MARGLMVVLALAATVAHAQETSKVAKGAKGAVLAVRPVTELRPGPLSPSSSSPNGGASAGSAAVKDASGKLVDCSSYQTLVRGDVPAIRTYAPPPPERPEKPTDAWVQVPYVRAVQRCDNLYLVQIWSQDPWVIAHARVEGPNGEALHVNALGSSEMKGNGWSVNVIAAEAPPGVTVPTLTLHLMGEDGRVAQLDARELP